MQRCVEWVLSSSLARAARPRNPAIAAQAHLQAMELGGTNMGCER